MSAFTYDESAGARAEAGTVGGHDGRASERGPCERRLRSVREADLSGALADLAVDAVFHFGGEGPNSGDTKGREAIETALINNFELTGGTQKLHIHSIFADDEHAVVSLRETANRTDGATLDTEEAHVLTIDAAGKITNLWDLPVDPEKHDRFFDGRCLGARGRAQQPTPDHGPEPCHW